MWKNRIGRITWETPSRQKPSWIASSTIQLWSGYLDRATVNIRENSCRKITVNNQLWRAATMGEVLYRWLSVKRQERVPGAFIVFKPVSNRFKNRRAASRTRIPRCCEIPCCRIRKISAVVSSK